MTVREFVRRHREGHAWLTNVSLGVLGVTLVLLARQFTFEIERFRFGFSGVSWMSVIAYVGAVLIVRTQPVNRATFRIVIGFACAMYAMTVFADPFLSSDIYRYVWDGLVQHAGISPYRYVPGNAVLTFLRAPNQEVFDNINRRDYAVTIYPPVAQMIYWVSTFFSPTVEAMKMLMLLFLGVGAWAVVRVLERLGRARAEVLLYLWCPLLVWEIGDGGHIDAAVIAFLCLAMLFRMRERPGLTGVFLGLAVMTKFYPLVLFPALYQRRDWKMPAAVVAVCVAGYAAYLSVGWKVFGFLSGYSKEEGLDSGTRYFLLEFARTRMGMGSLPNGAFYLLCAVVLGGMAVWAWRYASEEHVPAANGMVLGVPNFVKAATLMAFAMMLLFSPHYGWYLAWLAPFLALAPSVPLFVYVLGFFYGFTTGLADPGPKMFLLNERLYAVVAMSLAVHAVLRRWPVQGALMSRLRMMASREDAGRRVLVAGPVR